MTRLLMMGHELPVAASGAIEAKNYRTQQFVEPLLADGHEITLCASVLEEGRLLVEPIHPRLQYERIDFRSAGWLRRVRRSAREFQPQAMVGVTFISGLRASRLGLAVPRGQGGAPSAGRAGGEAAE